MCSLSSNHEQTFDVKGHVGSRPESRRTAATCGNVEVMDDVAFDEFDPPDRQAWLAESNQEYIQERVIAGDTVEEATANAEATIGRLFPGGSPAAGQLAGWLLSDGERIGQLWIGPFGSDPTRWWVWNIAIEAQYRSRGFGRDAMKLAERMAIENGATTLGLNVFAHNDVARHLYSSLGYEESSVQMRKELG